ncbi:right-handed parallel beta-helix repeat-containing protein [Cohnella sp. GCM10020058]|uniref:right-handed parallel beta-helix repeat-containing protein n=1 Tax=Cohnella sp. GCM10020058 TaxID=3317330 RepID=UPI00363AFA34
MKKPFGKIMSFILSASLVFAVAPGTQAYAATINVGGFTSSAIQSAINAAAAGDTVYFPAGTYNITSAIVPKTGIKLKGAGQTTTIVKYTGTTDQVLVNAANVSNLEISDLTFDANSNVHAVQGIDATNGTGFWIHHNAFKNFTATSNSSWGPMAITFYGNSTTQTGGVTNSTIENNTFTNIAVNSDWGAAIRFDNGSTGNKVLGNSITNTGRGGIFCAGSSTNAVIRGNTIAGSGQSLEGLGIELYNGCHNSVVEDNVIDHWISLDSTNNVSIRRNTISSTNASLRTPGIEIIKSSYIVTTDNTINGGQAYGFSIASPASQADGYSYYANNTVQYMTQWGIQLQGSAGGDILNQYFYNNRFLNTYVSDPNAPYPGYAGHGFRTNGYAKNVTLDSNEMSSNQGYGIEFASSTGVAGYSFTGNKIQNNTGASININPGLANLEWSGNTVTGNGTNTQLTSTGYAGNAKPTANFTASATSVTTNQAVTFTNTSTDNGSIAKSLWDFGDGVPVSTSGTGSVSYAYPNGGTYKVTLVVWDNTGRAARKETTITVGTAVQTKLSGTVFSDGGATWGPNDTADKVYDGNTATFYDSTTATGAYVGIDLGAGNAKTVTKIRFYPRAGQLGRMVGAKFQGSNTSGSSGFTDLYTVTTAPATADWVEVTISSGTPYRYLRYIGGANSYGNVNEVEFYGNGTAPPAAQQFTGTVLSDGGATWGPSDTADKVYDGNIATFYDSKTAAGAYAGIDLGAGNVKTVTKIRYYPRADQLGRIAGAKFQGSNTSGSSGFADFYTVTTAPATAGWVEVTISSSTPYRYLRYIGGADSYGNVSEVQFWGQ